MDFTLVMMLRRSHPGREVQGGAATCGWVLGGDSRSGGRTREEETLSFQRQDAIVV